MKFPEDVRNFIERKFKSRHRDWLKACVPGSNSDDKNEFPLAIDLGIPTGKEAVNRQNDVRAWIAAWNNWKGSGELIRAERNWQIIGKHTIPYKLILKNPADAVMWIGETDRWSRAVDRYKKILQRWPVLVNNLHGYFNVLADYDEPDFIRLYDILSWICAYPDSGFYIRQIPVTGIDTKWLESRKSLVSELMTLIQHGILCTPADQISIKSRDFFETCGFRPLPQLIRMRILDPVLRNKTGGLADISAPLDEIAALDIKPQFVFIVENLQTGLAFQDLNDSVVIMGLGYAVDALGKIPWLKNTQRIYWGDIDTHGFAILNRAKSYLPDLKTILMDEKTFLDHRELWVEEKSQSPADDLPLLTGNELMLYRKLRNNEFGYHVRLEQERIRWDEAWKVISEIAAGKV